jgi:hypothetical protein
MGCAWVATGDILEVGSWVALETIYGGVRAMRGSLVGEVSCVYSRNGC